MNPIAKSLRLAAKYTARNPSVAQKSAGNYRKGSVRIAGLDISIENPKGGIRSGVDKGGKKWSVTMPAHYGYVKQSEGSDGDHVDVYIGPDHDSKIVYVVDQVDAKTKSFDEHKCLLGYDSKAAALDDYTKAFSDGKGKDRIGSVTEMPINAFAAWVRHGKTKEPLGDLNKGYARGGAVQGFATGGGLDDYYGPETSPLDSDFTPTLASYPPLRDFQPFYAQEARGTGPGESRDPSLTRPQEYLTPAYEGASPAVGAYGMGTAIGDAAANLYDKNYGAAALAAVPLAIGAIVPGPKGMPKMAREIDSRGFYSPSLEAAKGLPQETGTLQQMRSMLLKYGAKPKELEATGFDKTYVDPNAKVSRAEIEEFLRGNRVQLGEDVRGVESQELQRIQAEIKELDAKPNKTDAEHDQLDRMRQTEDYLYKTERRRDPEYSQYSTPGGIPGSYREVVTTLPAKEQGGIPIGPRGWSDAHNANAAAGDVNYQSSHWPGITNPLLHYRVKDFQNSSVSGNPLAASGGDRLGLPSNDVETGSQLIPIHRGESAYNQGGKYFSTDRDWARQFTQGGRDSEVQSHAIKASDVYQPPEHVYGGDPDAIDAAVADAKSKGYKAVLLSEAKGQAPGQGEPASVFVFNKTALKPHDSSLHPYGSGDLGPASNQPRARTETNLPSKTRVLDELQSDWAQRARDQGTRDPAAIAELTKAHDDAYARQQAARDALLPLVQKYKYLVPDHIRENPPEAAQNILMAGKATTPEIQAEVGPIYDAWSKARNETLDLTNKLNAQHDGVPSAPYISNTSDWVDLGLKQALIDAARDPSVSRMAWAPGKVQADRYNLAKDVSALRYNPDTGGLQYQGRNPGAPDHWSMLDSGVSVKPDELANYVGRDVATELLAQPRAGDYGGFHTLRLDDTRQIGGEGMKSFYGDMTPEGYQSGIVGTRLQKLVKGLDPEAAKIDSGFRPGVSIALGESGGAKGFMVSYNGEVAAGPFPTREMAEAYAAKDQPTRYPSIPITPKLRKEILEKGLPLFLAPLLYGMSQKGQDSDEIQQLLEDHYGDED